MIETETAVIETASILPLQVQDTLLDFSNGLMSHL